MTEPLSNNRVVEEIEVECPTCKMAFPAIAGWQSTVCPYCSQAVYRDEGDSHGSEWKLARRKDDTVFEAKVLEMDEVDMPQHYQVFPEFGLEAKHIIARVLSLAKLGPVQTYWLGNSLKYLLRMGRKGSVKVDAGKAEHYARCLKEE